LNIIKENDYDGINFFIKNDLTINRKNITNILILLIENYFFYFNNESLLYLLDFLNIMIKTNGILYSKEIIYSIFKKQVKKKKYLFIFYIIKLF
jgi:hypothetical protein